MRNGRIAAFSVIIMAGTLCIAQYVKREQGGKQLESVQARLRGSDAASGNYIIRRGGRPMGLSKLAFAADPDSVEIKEDTQLWVPVPGGLVQQARQIASTILDKNLEMRRFEILIEAESGQGRVQRSVVRGQRIDKDSMLVSVSSGGGEQKARIKVPEGLAVGQTLWPRLAISGTLLVGSEFQTFEFDPLSLSVRKQQIKILKVDSAPRNSFPDFDKEDTRVGYMRVYTIEQKSNGLAYQIQVRHDGLPVRTVLPAGLSVDMAAPEDVGRLMGKMSSSRAPKELARQGDDATLIAASAIRAGVPTVGSSTIGKMRAVIKGMPSEHDMNGGVQKAHGDTVWVEQGNLTAGARVMSEAQFIQPSPFIESNEPEIAKIAQEIVVGARSNEEKTRKIVHWVWRRLDKRYTASFSSALQTLRAGAGDCTEHTALTVALLRNQGIPAREVVGIAYVRGSWFYHAWVEVDLGAGWQPVDPTFDEAPASAGRVRLFVGRDGVSRVLSLIGRLDLNILDASKAYGSHSIATGAEAGRR